MNNVEEVSKYSLEKQLSVANTILKEINKTIDEIMNQSLASFSLLLKDLGILDGKTVLLLQPEKYMTLGVFLCLNGAKTVYGLNRFVDSEERLSTYYEKLLDFILKNKKSIIIQETLSDNEIIKRYNKIVSIDKLKMRSYLNRDKIRFSLGEDTSMMPYDDGTFDIVISAYAIETLYYPFQSIDEIRRVMAADGLLYILTAPYGKTVKTSEELVNKLKHSREVYEKSFNYSSSNYCNMIPKSELLFHLTNFKFKVNSVKDLNTVKITDFDKKDINPHFTLCGEKDISTLSYIAIAHKKGDIKESFVSEDYKTYSKGLDLHYKGKYNAASARYESLKRKHPLDDRISHSLFNSLYFLKEYEKADNTFKQIKKITIKPTAKDYYYAGDALYNLKKYDDAKKYFIAAEKSDPKQYLAINAAGLCEFKKENLTDALKTMKRAVQIYPYYPDGLHNIGIILEQLDKKKAVEHFKMVLTIDPTRHQALLSMGRLLYEQAEYEEAGNYLKEYCLVDGTDEAALKMYIDCLMKLGLKRTARKELEDMLQRNPENMYISNMFEVYFAKTVTL